MNDRFQKTPEAMSGWAGPLDPGETLLWQGKPATGIRISKRNLSTSAFGLFLCGMALPTIITKVNLDSKSAEFPFSILFFILFISVGLYMLFGQYFLEAYRRKRTCYSLTEKRAIITTVTSKCKVTSWPITKDTKLEYASGDESNIHFAKIRKQDSDGGSYFETIGFEYIKNGEEVYQLIRRIQGAQL